jgi:hypothetical protein
VADFFDRAVTITQDISKQVSLCRYFRCVYVSSTIKAMCCVRMGTLCRCHPWVWGQVPNVVIAVDTWFAVYLPIVR